MGRLKKKIVLPQTRNVNKKRARKTLWCQNNDCLESNLQFKTNKELTKHIIHNHSTCSITEPRLHSLVNQYENEQYEYKMNMNSCAKDKICQTILAMANCLGGYIYFGINDDRIVYGIHNSSNWDKYMLEIASSLKYHSEPDIPIVKSHHIVLNRYYNLYYIEVLKCHKDYKFKGKKYVRCLSSNQLINHDYTYESLLEDNKKLSKRLDCKQKVIDELEEELDIKNKYIENILKLVR